MALQGRLEEIQAQHGSCDEQLWMRLDCPPCNCTSHRAAATRPGILPQVPLCKPVGGHAAGPRRREVTVPATWPALALGAGQGFQAAAAPAAARKQRRQQVKPPQQQQPGGTVDALIAAPVAASVTAHAQVAAPVASVASVAAPVAPVDAPVAVVAPAAAPVYAQIISLLQLQATQIQDLQRQQLQCKDSRRQLQLQNKDSQRQLLQLQQQMQDREDAFIQLQHQVIQVREEVQGNSRSQLTLEHAVHTCQRQQGQQRAQPSTSSPPQLTTQTPAQPPAQPVTQAPAQPQPPVQRPAQSAVQRAAQPQPPQSQPSSSTPAQQSPADIEETPGSAMVLPEERERRKRSADVVMYGLTGGSSACLRQAAQRVFQALNMPEAGQHVVAVDLLPTQGPHPPVVVRFDEPCWSPRLLRSKSNLRQIPALAKVYIAEHLTRIQMTEKTARQHSFAFAAAQQLGSAFWRGSEVMLHRRDASPGAAPEAFAC